MISKTLLIVNIFLLISIWVFVGLKYAGLPDIIPTHFDGGGGINGYDHKKTIWFLPAIATFVFLVLISITRDVNSPLLHVPTSFRNKKSMKLFAYSILFPLLLVFGDVVLESVWIAEGRIKALSNLFFVFLGLFFIVLAANLLIMIKKGKNDIVQR